MKGVVTMKLEIKDPGSAITHFIGMMMAVFENGERIAVHALEVKRNVFDAQHNPLPGQSVIEYWQKGKGKVKVVKSK